MRCAKTFFLVLAVIVLFASCATMGGKKLAKEFKEKGIDISFLKEVSSAYLVEAQIKNISVNHKTIGQWMEDGKMDKESKLYKKNEDMLIHFNKAFNKEFTKQMARQKIELIAINPEDMPSEGYAFILTLHDVGESRTVTIQSGNTYTTIDCHNTTLYIVDLSNPPPKEKIPSFTIWAHPGTGLLGIHFRNKNEKVGNLLAKEYANNIKYFREH
jgi:hypothetical protein